MEKERYSFSFHLYPNRDKDRLLIDKLREHSNKNQAIIDALYAYFFGNPPPPSNDATPPAPFNPSEFAEAVRDGLAEGIKGLAPVLASAMLPYRPTGNFAENSITPPDLGDLPPLIVAAPEPVDVNAQRDTFSRGLGDLFADEDE